MTDDPEIAAIMAAYNALKGMSRIEWTRALGYIGARLACDDRTQFISHGDALPAPVQWVIAGDLETAAPSPVEALLDCVDVPAWAPVEVNGVAVVSQRFAVMLHLAGEATEVEWFDMREHAERYCATARFETAALSVPSLHEGAPA